MTPLRQRLGLTLVLLLMGAGWGICVPLGKIAVSSGHQPLGLIFWQLVIVVAIIGVLALLRRTPVIFTRKYWRLYLAVAFCGALLPDVFYYAAAYHLPGGILAILLATVPMFSLTVASLLGMDRISVRRGLGVSFGLMGIMLLLGPEASVPGSDMLIWVLIALIAPLCYATEGNLVALWDAPELDAVQILLAGSLIALGLAFPLALISGQWINPLAGFGTPEAALVGSAVMHAVAYACYVWLVQRAGSVFAAQSSYLVNGFGIFWSMVLLGEAYAANIWLAVLLMLGGLLLVQPRLHRCDTYYDADETEHKVGTA